MVKYLLILITVFNPLLVKGQTSISFSKDEFTIDRIISILFEGEFDYNTSECKWRPNLAEKLQFGESHDGFLYTVLDTTYTHKNYSSNLTTMIVTTYVKD